MDIQQFPDQETFKRGFRTIENHKFRNKKKKYSQNKQFFGVAYSRLFKYGFRHPLHFFSVLLFSLLSQLGAIILPYLSGQVMNAIAHKNFDELKECCLWYLGSLLISSLSTFFKTLLLVTISDLVSNMLKNDAFEKFIQHDLEFYELHKTGELLSRIDSDIATLRWTLGSNLSKILRASCLLIGSYCFMFYLDWEISLMIMMIFPAIMGVSSIFSRFVKEYSKKYQEMIADSTMIADECFINIKTLKSFVQEENEIHQFKDILRSAYSTALKKAGLSGIYKCILTVLWYGGYQVLEGEMEYGTIVSFILYCRSYSQSIKDLSDAYTNVVVSSGIAEVLFELFDYQPKAVEFNSDGIKPEIQGDIQFKDVTFSYPFKPDVLILNQFNLHIKRGERVGFCGTSGGGKTTLIQILQKFYDIQGGEVLIDGINVKKYDIKHLRRNVSVVSQEPCLFSGTIEQNIAFGVEEYTKEELHHAADIANASEFIENKEKFPEGFNTLVGERGSRLSGGQKQRIAIARAIIKKPKILILDESTSALDAQSEHLVQKSIENLLSQNEVTMIIIAHRLSTIVNCNRILMFSNGKILEEGTHEVLLQKEGAYYELMRNQMDF